MDPTVAINLGFAVLNEAINLIKGIKAQAGMTDDQLAAHAEALDLENKADIKKLLAL
jgi:hypothetical protein